MSSVSKQPSLRIVSTTDAIPEDSLLEYLYTYSTLDQLNAMLVSQPDYGTLVKWNVTVDEYKANVRTAIELVIRD